MGRDTLSAIRIKELLNENDMKAVDLCNKTGIHKATISQYIHGTHIPTNLKAKLIAEVFNVNPLWIMGFSDVSKYVEEVKDIPSPEFTEVDAELLELFHKVSDSDQQIIMSMLRRMAE